MQCPPALKHSPVPESGTVLSESLSELRWRSHTTAFKARNGQCICGVKRNRTSNHRPHSRPIHAFSTFLRTLYYSLFCACANANVLNAFAEELPIRLAHRAKELDSLPHNLSEMPSINKVKNWYCQSFEVSPLFHEAISTTDNHPGTHHFSPDRSHPST